MEGVIAIILIFGGSALILWKFFDSRHKEKMILIEKGLVNEDLKYLYSNRLRSPNRYSTLKWGLVALFIGLAVLLSIWLQQFSWADQHVDALYPGMIFLGAGLAFLIYFAIASKKGDKE